MKTFRLLPFPALRTESNLLRNARAMRAGGISTQQYNKVEQPHYGISLLLQGIWHVYFARST